MYAVEGCGETIRGNGMTADANALGGFIQMRRSEQAGAPAGGMEARLDHRAGGAFSIGSGNVDEAAAILRAAQRIQEDADPVEPELRGLDFVSERVEEVYGIGIVHLAHEEPQRPRDESLHFGPWNHGI